MTSTISSFIQNYRWIGMVALTLALQLVVMSVIGYASTRHTGFEDWQIFGMVALFCLPAAWAAFSLWRFRSPAERLAGYFAAVASLYWLWAAAAWLAINFNQTEPPLQ